MFDESKYFLGFLCKNGHDYEGTGMSLYYLSNRSICLTCDRERARQYRAERAASRKAQERSQADHRKALLESAGLDPAKYRLGQLCKLKHDWNQSGFTLRYVKAGKCVECHRAEKRAEYHANPEQRQAYGAEYYAANQERLLEQKKDYYRRNRDRKLAKDREYREANLDKIKARNKAWYERNKDRQRAYSQARYADPEIREQILIQKRRYGKENRSIIRQRWNRWRATPEGRVSDNRSKARRRTLKQQNHHADILREQWLERVAQFGGQCAYCRTDLQPAHIDHFIPISKGGSDVIGNLIPCCQSCNSSKSNRDPKEWFQSQPFYSKQRWDFVLKVLGKTESNYNQIPLL